jgi:lipopolysaccharide/colanic/teichoic acid biosynthesis glycosyltransferase
MKIFLYLFFKRLIDIALSLIGILILSPVLTIVCLLQLFIYGRKIFFIQKRVGLHGVIFKVYKFKTMNDKKDLHGEYLHDKERVTKFGSFLRSSSIDELPQLFNILKGDMSIVGPRPQSIENCFFMNKEQFSRHHVKPGLTGLSAINGRNAVSWDKKIQFDLEYINRRSLWLDLRIMFITFIKVIKRENVFSGDQAFSLQMGEELLQKGIINDVVFQSVLSKSRSFSNKNLLKEDLFLDKFSN